MSSLTLFAAAVSDGDSLPCSHSTASPKQMPVQELALTASDSVTDGPELTGSSASSLSDALPAGFTASDSELEASRHSWLRCRCSCLQRRPLQHHAETWLQLEGSLRVRVVTFVTQFVYGTLLVAAMLGIMIDLAANQGQPGTLSGELPLVMTAAAAVLAAALLDIVSLVARMPDSPFTAWHARYTRLLYNAQRLAYLLAIAGFVLLFLVLTGLVFPSDNDEHSVGPLIVLWMVAAVEGMRLALSMLLYRWLHLVFPHELIPISCPFLPSWQSVQQWEHDHGDESEPQAKQQQQLAFSRSELQSIAPMEYSSGMRGRPVDDNLCVICIGQMEAGDAVRIFSCRHCFHSPCADDWLVRSKTCPLCVAVVTPPRSFVLRAKAIEMAAIGSASSAASSAPTV